MNKVEIINLLQLQWQNLLNLGKSLDNQSWFLPTECPGWDVKDIFAHIIGTEKMLLGNKPPETINSTYPEHVKNQIGEINEKWVQYYKNFSPDEIINELKTVTSQRVNALIQMDDSDFEKLGPTPVGIAPYSEFMSIRLWDCFIHEQDIRVATDTTVKTFDKELLNEILGRLTKALAYVLAKRVQLDELILVSFNLTDQEKTIHLHKQNSRVQPTHNLAGYSYNSMVTIDLSFLTLLRLVSGRTTYSQVKQLDTIRINGDNELAVNILENLNVVI